MDRENSTASYIRGFDRAEGSVQHATTPMAQTFAVQLLRNTSRKNAPWQIAMGLALGLSLAMLPFGSLLFVVAVVALWCLPIHLVAAFTTAALVATVLHTLELRQPLEAAAQPLGAWALQQPTLSDFWMRWESIPFAPWLELHNTQINGCLLIAAIVWLPTFVVLHPILRRFVFAVDYHTFMAARSRADAAAIEAAAVEEIDSQPNSASMLDLEPGLDELQILDLSPLMSIEKNADQEQRRAFEEVAFSANEPSKFESSESLDEQLDESLDMQLDELDGLLAERRAEQDEPLQTDELIARAAEVAELVDDILASYDDLESVEHPQPRARNSRIERIDAPETLDSIRARIDTATAHLDSLDETISPELIPPESIELDTLSEDNATNLSSSDASPETASPELVSPAPATPDLNTLRRPVPDSAANETLIEIVRLDSQESNSLLSTNLPSDKKLPVGKTPELSGVTPAGVMGRPASAADSSAPFYLSSASNQPVAAAKLASESPVQARPLPPVAMHPHDETLHYLLSHLREINDKG